eukprot:Gb_23681 [translate_table: standard]
MVQASGKSTVGVGHIPCSLPMLAAIAATLAVVLGVVITPWIGLPLKYSIQNYIWDTNFTEIGRTAEYIGNKSVDLIKNSTVPGYSYERVDNKGRKDHADHEENPRQSAAQTKIKELKNSTVPDYSYERGDNKGGKDHPGHEENPRQSAAQTKIKELNGGPDKNGASKPFPVAGNHSAGTDSKLQPKAKQLESNRSQTSDGSPGGKQEKSTSTAKFHDEEHSNEQKPSPSLTDFHNDSAAVTPALTSAVKCNLFQGKWVHDSFGPLYKNDTCPVLTQAQNCQGNGRPDKDYEYWRWQPVSCDLPRFDAYKFLQIMHGKTLAFVGDSVARNQMESLMCILWQVETPRNIGNKKMQRWFFRSQSVTIIRIWSAWLVHTSAEAFQFAPEGLTKLHLDKVDETFMDYLPKIDVLVISSGHWFVKKTAYLLKEEVVGGQLWWKKGYERKIDNAAAFALATETALKGIVSYPNYTGLTIFRTYSPDHYEGGAWNTGGSCTGKVRPFTDHEVTVNGFTQLMRTHQMHAYEKAKKNLKNRSKLILMDITSVFEYRADGHPGPYRSLDPNKITKRGPNGQPPPQDCLHWCMPGPVDTWNEFVFEIVRRHLNGSMNDM